jgi:two-component system OmpR family response regulator
MASPHILVVEDDRLIRKGLVRLISDNGMRATEAANGSELKHAMQTHHFDLVLLDVMLPGDNGFVLGRQLREHSNVSIIHVTARTSDNDKLLGFETGADDYVVKPFNPTELLARIKAVLRRAAALPGGQTRDGQAVYRFDGWRFDIRARELISPKGVRVELSAAEFDLLQVFVEHPQIVLSREQLLDQARGRSPGIFDRGVDVLISRLRRKIEDNAQTPRMIKTVRGSGYILTAQPESPQP